MSRWSVRVTASLLLMLAWGVSVASAATYQVGPGRPYASLNQVEAILNPGDIVEVDGNVTYPSIRFTRAGTAANPITIRGLRVGGNRPVIAGGTNTVQFELSNYYLFEGFEVTGGSSRCVFVHAGHITIRDTLVRDCTAQGILGADEDAGWLTLEYVEVRNSGATTQRHPIYVSSDPVAWPGATFRMRYCYVHDGTGGNAVKSRAERNEIYYNWIENGFYRELELIGIDSAFPPPPRAMHSDIVGNVFIKGVGRSSSVVRVGHDQTDANGSRGRYRFVNNVFVADTLYSTMIQAFGRVETVEAHNNVFYRRGGPTGAADILRILNEGDAIWEAGSRRSSGSNNWIMNGSTMIPPEWTGTIAGNDPAFENFGTRDVRPAAGSPLVNAGSAGAPASPSGYPFPSPLYPPAFHPPLHTVGAPASARPANGRIDIGVYESGGAPGCSYAISPSSDAFGANGGTDSVGVSAGAGCSWTGVSNSAWITVTSGAAGTGTGAVDYAVAANGTTSARTGTLTIAGQTFTVNQAAGSSGGGGGTVSVYVDQQNVTFAGGSAGTQAAVVAGEGVNGSLAVKHTGLTQWAGTKRLHFAGAVDISSVLATDTLQISLDLSAGGPASNSIYVYFNDNWQAAVAAPAIDSVPGYQTWTLDISAIRALLGNGVNDIYFKAGNGFPANGILWVDEIKFVRP